MIIYIINNIMDKNYFSFANDKYKIVIVGDANVGKSSIFWRFT